MRMSSWDTCWSSLRSQRGAALLAGPSFRKLLLGSQAAFLIQDSMHWGLNRVQPLTDYSTY